MGSILQSLEGNLGLSRTHQPPKVREGHLMGSILQSDFGAGLLDLHAMDDTELLSEEMEDPTFFSQIETMNSIVEYPFEDDINFSEAFDHQVDDLEIIRSPLKQVNDNNWNCCNLIPPKAPSSSSSSHIISFENSSSSTPPNISHQYYGLEYCDFKPKDEVSKWVGSSSRTPLHAQEHVIAERKRREKISQSFLSLSALIPDLKKKDKNSVLGDAIEYLKQLQQRMATLEEQVAKKTVESVKLVKKTHFYTSYSNPETQSDSPEIEARVSNKDVLIRIHCNIHKGCISNIINEIEKLHLSVITSNVLPFGQATLDITIVAKMEAEFSMTLKDLVKTLRHGLLKLM